MGESNHEQFLTGTQDAAFRLATKEQNRLHAEAQQLRRQAEQIEEQGRAIAGQVVAAIREDLGLDDVVHVTFDVVDDRLVIRWTVQDSPEGVALVH